jgi:hypothetical protein
MKNKRLALIDADIVVYRIAYAGQDSKHSVLDKDGDCRGVFETKTEANDFCELLSFSGELEPRIETEIIPKEQSEIDMMTNIMIKNIRSGSRSSEYHMYLSGHTNFRNELGKTLGYKENRSGKVKPHYYQYIRDFIEENHPCTISDGCEADDLLAMRMYPDFLKSKESKRKSDCESIICTIDKDLRNVPGYHYHIVKGKIDWVTPRGANRFFAEQLMTGDKADNIPGLTILSEKEVRVGPKWAQNAIQGCISLKTLDKAVRKAYSENVAGDWEGKLQEVGSLLWMQREPGQMFDYDKWAGGEYE